MRQTLGHPNERLFFRPRQNTSMLPDMVWIAACLTLAQRGFDRINRARRLC